MKGPQAGVVSVAEGVLVLPVTGAPVTIPVVEPPFTPFDPVTGCDVLAGLVGCGDGAACGTCWLCAGGGSGSSDACALLTQLQLVVGGLPGVVVCAVVRVPGVVGVDVVPALE